MANDILNSLGITLENLCKIYAIPQMSNKKVRSFKLFDFIYNFILLALRLFSIPFSQIINYPSVGCVSH